MLEKNQKNIVQGAPIMASQGPKQLVAQSYDQMAEAYTKWTAAKTSPRTTYTEHVLSLLTPESSRRAVELGCGAGGPVLDLLTGAGLEVTANDISAKQLSLARGSYPNVTFQHGDMLSLDFAASSISAIVSFYALIHLPRDEQKAMLALIHGWLEDDGVFACNLATSDKAEIRSEFFGEPMFWSSFAVDVSRAMIAEAGFEIVRSEVLGESDSLDETDPDYQTTFFWVLARKKGPTSASSK